jgi:hypothetical protein
MTRRPPRGGPLTCASCSSAAPASSAPAARRSPCSAASTSSSSTAGGRTRSTFPLERRHCRGTSAQIRGRRAAPPRPALRRGRGLGRVHARSHRAGHPPLRRPHAPVRLHQLRERVPEASVLLPHHRGHAARQPALAVLARQDRLRRPARARVPRRGLSGDDRPPLAHLRAVADSARPRQLAAPLDDDGPDAARGAGDRPRRRDVVVDGDVERRLCQGPRRTARPRGARGHAFHITSDEVLTWDAIYREAAHAIGVEPVIVHIASDWLAERHPAFEGRCSATRRTAPSSTTRRSRAWCRISCAPCRGRRVSAARSRGSKRTPPAARSMRPTTRCWTG